MIRGHAVYEALAGAILLREASTAECAEYARHAATCPQCDADIDQTRTLVHSALTASQHGETWRPDVRDGVGARIERRSASWDGFVRSALTLAVAGTLALNVALLVGSVHLVVPDIFGGGPTTVAARTAAPRSAPPVARAEVARAERLRAEPSGCLEIVASTRYGVRRRCATKRRCATRASACSRPSRCTCTKRASAREASPAGRSNAGVHEPARHHSIARRRDRVRSGRVYEKRIERTGREQ
jgi:hypothetical protein